MTLDCIRTPATARSQNKQMSSMMPRMIKKAQQSLYQLLRWSEQYVKTDTVYLAKGGGFLFSGYAISTFAGLILAVGLANLLPKDVYGQYSFIIALAGIIGTFTITGLGTATTRAVAQGFYGTLQKSFAIYLRWGIIPFSIACAGALYYAVNENYTLSTSLLIIGFLIPFSASASLYNAFLAGKQAFKTKTLYNTIQNIVPPLCILLAAYYSNNPVIIIFAYFASTATITLILYLATIKKFNLRNYTQTDPDTLKYGKHLSVMDILGSLSLHLDKVLIFHYMGAVQLATYTFAITVPRQLQNVNKILKTLIFPKLAKRDLDELKQSIPRKAFLLFGASFIITGLYIASAPFIYQFFFPQYTESVIYSQVFALVLLFFPSMLFNQTLLAHMKKKELYIIKISTPLLRIGLLLTLLPPYGIWGAIIAILATRAIEFGVQVFLFYRVT